MVYYAVVAGGCLNRYRKGVLDFATSDQVRFKEYSLSVDRKSFNLAAIRNNYYYQGCDIESCPCCVKAPREASKSRRILIFICTHVLVGQRLELNANISLSERVPADLTYSFEILVDLAGKLGTRSIKESLLQYWVPYFDSLDH